MASDANIELIELAAAARQYHERKRAWPTGQASALQAVPSEFDSRCPLHLSRAIDKALERIYGPRLTVIDGDKR